MMSTHSRISSLTSAVPPRSRLYQGFFGRLFPDLPAWHPPKDKPNTAQAPDRAQDQNPDTIQGPDEFFKNSAVKMIEPDGEDFDSDIPAGYTYFGQFIDHDITFDPASSLVRQNDPNMLHNFRTPRLDLDNVYLNGPEASPHLYERNAKGQPIGRFLIGAGANENEPDLPRNQIGTALIGDPRNDENVIVSQLQLAFLKFHNRIFDETRKKLDDQAAYVETRRIVTWTYQYVVWHDFVKRIINDTVWSSVLKLIKVAGIKRWALNTQFYDWRNTPFMPIEFSVAAYRFGHSLVRDRYEVNVSNVERDENGNVVSDENGRPKFLEIPVFDLNNPKNDLRGGQKLKERHTIQWDWFLKLPTSRDEFGFPQKTRKIDPFLSQTLAKIPAGPGGSNALAFLNLKRGWRMGLPSGPDVAKHLGLEPIKINSPHEEILWVYILKEAADLPGDNKGEMLGRVGSTIVGEVFAGLLAGDPNSFFNIDPLWTPSKEPLLADKGPVDGDEGWQLGDIIRLAKMPENGRQVTSLITTGQLERPRP
ncbi:MAG: heme peroxidase family protein [Chloroflexota bacterium]